MFGRKKRNRRIEVTRLSSLIADNLHVVGDVHFTGGLRIDGRVEGRVVGEGDEKSLVVLSEKGCVVGGVHSYDAVINGRILGDLVVEHFLELQAGAIVSGNIRYRQLQMDCGATVEGKLVRVEDEESSDSASTAGDNQTTTKNEPQAPEHATQADVQQSATATAGSGSSNASAHPERPATAAATQINADRTAVKQARTAGDSTTGIEGISDSRKDSR